MFRSKICQLLVLFFMVELSISAIAVGKDMLDLERMDSSEETVDNVNLENYNKEPSSVFKKTEMMQMITNKSYELKIYLPKNKSNEQMDKESFGKTPLIAKLLISSVTKFMMNGEQVGDVKIKKETINLEGEFVTEGDENISGDVTEKNKTETIPTASNPDSDSSEKTEKEDATETEKETEKNDNKETEKNENKETEKEDNKETEKDDSKETEKEEGESPVTSSQPSVMVPTKPLPELPNTNTSGPKNTTENITDNFTSALVSATAGVYGSLLSHIVLLLPIIIGLTFI
ncbi:hypothetical protein Anas_01508 [Armadillidium nasatum]|uniref:Uncharacterized protein n=1 Tax=Armadillidium nasatum TaxID=96803 RepID=A0A5N5THA6_9CRUS|nr:hypothetical protein Anas_01508 [Armadillidium nasatum]